MNPSDQPSPAKPAAVPPPIREALDNAFDKVGSLDRPWHVIRDEICTALAPFFPAPAVGDWAEGCAREIEKLSSDFRHREAEIPCEHRIELSTRLGAIVRELRHQSAPAVGEATKGVGGHCFKCGRGIALCACLEPDYGSGGPLQPLPGTTFSSPASPSVAATDEQGGGAIMSGFSNVKGHPNYWGDAVKDFWAESGLSTDSSDLCVIVDWFTARRTAKLRPAVKSEGETPFSSTVSRLERELAQCRQEVETTQTRYAAFQLHTETTVNELRQSLASAQAENARLRGLVRTAIEEIHIPGNIVLVKHLQGALSALSSPPAKAPGDKGGESS